MLSDKIGPFIEANLLHNSVNTAAFIMFVSLLLEKTEQSDMVELLKDTLREQESMLEEQSEILNSKVEEIQGWETGKSSWPHFILSSKFNPA